MKASSPRLAKDQPLPWTWILVISSIPSLILGVLEALFHRQEWMGLVAWSHLTTLIVLGWISRQNWWAAVVGYSLPMVFCLYFVIPTEYGAAGQFAYSVGSVLFSTIVIAPVAAISHWMRNTDSNSPTLA